MLISYPCVLAGVYMKFNVAVIDPPWSYYGSKDKWAAAGKFYDQLSYKDLCDLEIKKIMQSPCVIFMWCTSSTMKDAIGILNSWGYHYRGVAFVWVKTKKDGEPYGAAGVRPSITKPLTEFVLVASDKEKGRPLVLSSESVVQTVFSPDKIIQRNQKTFKQE